MDFCGWNWAQRRWQPPYQPPAPSWPTPRKNRAAWDVYYIATDKCTECVGFHDEPQCAAVCPVDCCVDDPDHRESEDQLLAKKAFMHL